MAGIRRCCYEKHDATKGGDLRGRAAGLGQGAATLTFLPWLLLASTLIVRYLLARKNAWGWRLDLLSVGPWLLYYANHGDWPLLAVPLIFGALDLKALRWWRE